MQIINVSLAKAYEKFPDKQQNFSPFPDIQVKSISESKQNSLTFPDFPESGNLYKSFVVSTWAESILVKLLQKHLSLPNTFPRVTCKQCRHLTPPYVHIHGHTFLSS